MSVLLEAPDPPPVAFDAARLRARTQAVLAALDLAEAELSLALVADEEIAKLNEQWRGRSGPTDVLSFSLREGAHVEHGRGLLGDVVIGLGVAARQAETLGHALDEELLRLTIHGVLHLLGHDHEQEEEARRMQAEEARLRRCADA